MFGAQRRPHLLLLQIHRLNAIIAAKMTLMLGVVEDLGGKGCCVIHTTANSLPHVLIVLLDCLS